MKIKNKIAFLIATIVLFCMVIVPIGLYFAIGGGFVGIAFACLVGVLAVDIPLAPAVVVIYQDALGIDTEYSSTYKGEWESQSNADETTKKDQP